MDAGQQLACDHIGMTDEERATVKRLAYERPDVTQDLLVCIVQWQGHRRTRVPFTEYVSQWAAARRDGEAMALKELYPLKGLRRIADDASDWDSYGNPRYDFPRDTAEAD